jgi:GAF domain-containing protein
MRREKWLPFRKRTLAPKEDGQDSSDRLLLADVNGHRDEVDTEFATDWDDLSGVEVVAGEFVTTTAETTAAPRDEPIGRLLQDVRARTGMDVVFISQFVHGQRLIRHVAADPRDPHAPREPEADPLEATYCQRVLDGRLPAALPDARAHPEAARLPITAAHGVRAHVAVPILASDGRVFGTVCAYAHRARTDLEHALAVLKGVARALAKAIEEAEQDER